ATAAISRAPRRGTPAPRRSHFSRDATSIAYEQLTVGSQVAAYRPVPRDNCFNETNGGNLHGKRTDSRSEDRRSADTSELCAGHHRLSAAASEFDCLDGSPTAREPHPGRGEDRRRLRATDRPFHGER